MKFFHLQLLALLVHVSLSKSIGLKSMNDDILLPYGKKHGSKHKNRNIRDIQSKKFGNSTFEMWMSHSSPNLFPVTNTSYFVSDIPLNQWGGYNYVYGHHTIIQNPLLTFSVIEPTGLGCYTNITATVEQTAQSRKCLVAQNGGFFQTETGSCIGNVVSDGKLVQDSGGIQNAHFGVTKNGTLITGYLSEEDVVNLDFQQLIGGVIWLVRNGTAYVEEAIQLEAEDSQETGSLRYFVDVQSARTAIGHDGEGRIIMVQVDGQTGRRGLNLNAFARFLIEQLGLVNAINLDGGGSATLVLNGSLANYPSDHCVGAPMWRCARSVSTIICGHEPDCVENCEHGVCINGECECNRNWMGDACDVLTCGRHNCSNNGVCNPAGCVCDAGWFGEDCTFPCQKGKYGLNCSQTCRCERNSGCNAIDGSCSCLPGYMGIACDQECPIGKYGINCLYHCHCDDCLCDAKSGECLRHINNDTQWRNNVTQCLARIHLNDVDMNRTEGSYDVNLLGLLCFSLSALMVSVFINILFMWRAIHKPSITNQIGAIVTDDQSESSLDYSSLSTNSSSSSDATPSAERNSRWKSFLHKLTGGGSTQYVKLQNNGQLIEMVDL